jgi:hypothetical protein
MDKKEARKEFIRRMQNSFYFDKDTNKIDIKSYGDYRLGLTKEEIQFYLLCRAFQNNLRRKPEVIFEKFNEIAGCNTCAVVQGKVLMYRHDVERFADVLFEGKSTYFD